MSRSRAVLSLAVGASLVLALTACGIAMPVPTPTPTATLTPNGDGVLRFGTIFPTSGQVAFLGAGQVAGVELAVRDINEAGGVNGAPVEVFHRDSGDATTSKAEESFADLLTKGVDVVIGPSSSALVEKLLPAVASSGVTMISPAATYPQLTANDTSGLFFRTIPSYGQQGVALGELLPKGGAKKVAIVYLDDALGQSLEKALSKSLKKNDAKLTVSEGFAAGTTDFAATIAAVTKGAPDVVVLATPGSAVDQTKALITQLSAAGFGGAKLWLTSQNLADYSQALPAGLLTGVNGIMEGADPGEAFLARLKQQDPALGETRYAAEAYDATILAALAATVSKDDAGTSVAFSLRSVSSGGVKCASFAECLDVLRSQDDIDYDGISGPVNFTATGDIASANYGVFAYNAENKFARVSTLLAG